MTAKVMQELEEAGLIRRLCPGKDRVEPESGGISDNIIYSSRAEFGSHMLLSVTVGATDMLKYFGMHSENEEVFLIGSNSWKPLFLTIARCNGDVFRAKLAAGELDAADFVCLEARYNDPEASFFVINGGTIHGECVADDVDGCSPSFYVTEARNTDLQTFDTAGIELSVER